MANQQLISLAGGALLVTCGAAYWSFKRWRWQIKSESHSFFSALQHYVSVNALTVVGRYMQSMLEKDTTQCSQVQAEYLMSQIQRNVNTDYGKENGFAEIKCPEDYVRLHPLTRYDHYRTYIDRVANGEDNVLTADKPYILGVTSGTSGQNKLLPTIRKLLRVFFAYGISVMIHTMCLHFPGMRNPQRGLKFAYTPRWRYSPAGILVGPSSYVPKQPSSMLNLYSTPPPALDVLTEPEALYIHLLFGLKDRNIGSIEANFVSMIYTAFQSLRCKWPQLVLDIEAGVIDPDLKIDGDVRTKLDRYMSPDPARAAELKAEFEKGFEGITKRIWPHINLVLSGDSGSLKLYGDLLKQCECKGVPFYSPFYAASEGLVAVNIDPLADGERQYLLVPRAMFYEFIPIEDSEEDQPNTLFMDQVKEGEIYELVITNISGLCRYRFGDVVKVAGFHNHCPKVVLMYRQGQFLNVRGEKTSEQIFYSALQEAVAGWEGIKLQDYCCVESALLQQSSEMKIEDAAPFYGVFLEVEDGQHPTDEQMSKIDETLQQKTYIYESFRSKRSIAPMRVWQVKPGTFRELKLFMVEITDASLNQFKVPRVMRRAQAVRFLLDRVVTS